MKYTSIAISGSVASGTSTAAKNVANNLNFKYHSAGDFFRQYALDHNIPLHDKAQVPDNLDKKIDDELTHEANNDPVIIDAHYIGYFTRNSPHVLKVLLTCDYKTRIKRALSRKHTHIETEWDIKKREEGLNKKFRKLYADENFLDPKFFDLVIDTTNNSPDKVAQQIVERFSTG